MDGWTDPCRRLRCKGGAQLTDCDAPARGSFPLPPPPKARRSTGARASRGGGAYPRCVAPRARGAGGARDSRAAESRRARRTLGGAVRLQAARGEPGRVRPRRS
eukprot:scaffold7379_cov366-Prasinococcus_capsulatus_cf.AAC.5